MPAPAATNLKKSQFPDDEIEAGLVLSSALLAQAKTAEARDELGKLRPLGEKTENRELSLRFKLEQGRILLAEHDLRSAHTLVEMVSKAAESSGTAEIAWEAQTVLAEEQRASGNAAEASKQLNVLEARERSAGFILLASKTRTVQVIADSSRNRPGGSR